MPSQSPISRRHLLASSGAMSMGFLSLRRALEAGDGGLRTEPGVGFGPLRPDPKGVFDLPEGFSYRRFGETGEEMDDGLRLPGAHDGAASFAAGEGRCLLVRNHELTNEADKIGPFGAKLERFGKVDKDLLFDAGDRKGPALGGTTTTLFNTAAGRVEAQWLSLTGTVRNCAGGATPWGSWVTCEESVFKAGKNGYTVDHGYNFEVPARNEIGLCKAEPLYDMGRFNHEAIAVDPRTGIVYQTEDRHSSLLYRFIPHQPGKLRAGGRLQALVITDLRGAKTSNYKSKTPIAVGQRLRCHWIDIRNVRSPLDDLRKQGHSQGAARFDRGEGMWWGADEAWFACTEGGENRKGQVWRYVPDLPEKGQDLAKTGGQLELFFEPNDKKVLDKGDNITVSPFGDLFICEDGGGEQNMIGINPEGKPYRFGRNALNKSELTGVHFSPDGSTLFVNVQRPGFTLAITGPFKRSK